MSNSNPFISTFGNILNNAFPKGLVGEMIFADLFGGKNKAIDNYDFVDTKAHLIAHEQHHLTSQVSDPLNFLLNRLDSDGNFIAALIVATRIQDPQLRQQALNLTLQNLQNNGFGFLAFD